MLKAKEIKQLAALLNRLGDVRKGLPQPVFDALCKVVVFPSCEVVVVNGNNEILLTYRHDKFWRGWHFPGRLIRYGQSFEQCLKQTVEIELGAGLASAKFLYAMDYNRAKRGPNVSVVYLCRLRGRPKAGKFFKTMPKDIIFEHKRLWKKLRKELK